MRTLSVALLTMLSLAAPSLSQGATQQSECSDAFKAADVIQDGVLTHTEIAKAKQVPPELAKDNLVSRQDFMTACVKAAQAKLAGKPAASPHGPGVTVIPESPNQHPGQPQPQGKVGPLETQSGGAPPESPQGQTPPGMQAAPEGSSKIIVGPDTKR